MKGRRYLPKLYWGFSSFSLINFYPSKREWAHLTRRLAGQDMADDDEDDDSLEDGVLIPEEQVPTHQSQAWLLMRHSIQHAHIAPQMNTDADEKRSSNSGPFADKVCVCSMTTTLAKVICSAHAVRAARRRAGRPYGYVDCRAVSGCQALPRDCQGCVCTQIASNIAVRPKMHRAMQGETVAYNKAGKVVCRFKSAIPGGHKGPGARSGGCDVIII